MEVALVTDRPRSATTLATQLARLLARDLAAAMAPLGLAPAQLVVLRELWKGDGLTQSDLAARLGVEQATMAKTLARMVRDGLVTREKNPRDARSQLIRLRERGRDLKKPAKAVARAVNARALDGLSDKEQGRLLDLLDRVATNLKAPRDEEAAGASIVSPLGGDAPRTWP